MSTFTLLTGALAAFAAFVSADAQPSGNPIYTPGLNSIVQAGTSYNVTWGPTSTNTITIYLLQGASTSLAMVGPIARGIPNTGSYLWQVNSGLKPYGNDPAMGYGLELVDGDQFQYSTQFGIAAAGSPGSSSSSSSSSSSASDSSATSSAAASSSTDSGSGDASSTASDSATATAGYTDSTDVAASTAASSTTAAAVSVAAVTTSVTTHAATTAFSNTVSAVSKTTSATNTAPTAVNTNGAVSFKSGGAAGIVAAAALRAATSATTVPFWIDGHEITCQNTFDVTSPNTSRKIWSVSSVSKDGATKAVEAAQRAFKTWRREKPLTIRNILLKAADIFEARVDELSTYMREETGAAEMVIKINVMTTAEMLRGTARRISGIHGSIVQSGDSGREAFIFKEPFGVNHGIAPWNAPLILGARSFLYAVATGNTVVLKGSELSPRCFWALGSVMHEVGLPAGVLNIIYHRPQDAADITNHIIEHPLVRKVNFTGSTAVGSIISAKAGKELKPVVMELGGKTSAVVPDDADIEVAAKHVALSAFLHSGQICMSTERVLVHSSILEHFGEALKKAIASVFSADQDAPTLVATAAVEKNAKLVKDAVDKGAKLLYGDVGVKDQSAYTMRPIVVSGVKKGMDLFYTESFGPTVSLIPIDDNQHAIDPVNDTEYGLNGAVFMKDLARGLRIAREIDSGATHIDSMTVHDEPTLPHGGVKKSGWGRFNAQWGPEEFFKTKTITYDM